MLCSKTRTPLAFDRTAIAHQIREQVHQFSKSLMQVGYAFDGSPIADEEVAETVLPPLGPGARTVLRDPAARPQYGPILIELLPDELERLDKEHVKEPKRKRRGGRGRRAAAAAGSQAPERETPLTMRTSLTAPAPNVVRNAARGNGQSQSNNAAAAASDASGNRRGRRAAAVAATQATAAMLAADRALDRAEREGRGIDDDEESDDDDDDSEGRPPTRQFIARG